MSKAKTNVETPVEEQAQGQAQTPQSPLQTDGKAEFQAQTQLPSDTQTAGDNAGNTQGKTFTQAELETILKQRLDQERKKFADYDDLKAKAKAIEDGQKSQQEKDSERLQQLEAATQKLAKDKQDLAIKLAAKDFGLDADAAIKLIDQSAIQITDGEVTNATDLVKAVAEKYPGLTTQQKRNAPNVPAVNPSKSAAPSADQLNQQRRREYFGGGTGNFWSGGGVQLHSND